MHFTGSEHVDAAVFKEGNRLYCASQKKWGPKNYDKYMVLYKNVFYIK